MYKQIFESMRSITHSGWLKINESLVEEEYYIAGDGTYCCYGDNNLLLIENNTYIYEYNEINLVKYVMFRVRGFDSDIKLYITNGEGDSRIIHAKNREVENDFVTYFFEVNDVPLLIKCICPNNEKYLLNSIKITGDSISKLRDIIISIGNAFNEVRSSEDEVIKEFNKDIAHLKSQKEELEEEARSLIETNKRLHETKDVEENQLNQTREHVESVRSELSNLNNEVKNNLDLKSKQSKEIRDSENRINSFITEISEKEIKVEELENKINKFKEEESRFSEDFSSYKEEIRNQNIIYIFLLVVFLILTTVVSVVIYKSALSTVDNFQFNFDLWTHLVSRLPIIFINIFLLGALTSVIYFLINIITENSKNIAATKQVSYLVKECVDSQKQGLDGLDEDAILKQRVESKMELIKSLVISKKEHMPQKIEKANIQEIAMELWQKSSESKKK
ncbi:hypothetical protein AAY62_15230 [Vibrio parahaemolyticus]|nr:hypothetical protein AAY62_15230 [Vibrio parahaemolyticus]